MSELDRELRRLEARSTALFERAIAGDMAALEAYLEIVDRKILLLTEPTGRRH